jgi:hypothetical protein
MFKSSKKLSSLSKTKSKTKSKSKSKKLSSVIKSNPHFNSPDKENKTPIKKVIDDEFVEKYKKNKVKLLHALKLSGIHTINKKKQDAFINNQLSPFRRRAAQDLLENTHYITLKETFHIIETLILQVYQVINTALPIYMYCGPNNKSFYFFACIALYCIEKYNTKNPSRKLKMPIFVANVNDDFLLNLGGSAFIIVDDVSYSGAQLAKMIDKYHYMVCIERQQPPPNIHVLLTALNDISLDKLSKITLTKTATKSQVTATQGPSPFNIMYLPERLYPSLVRVLGIERYFYINLFFNAFLSSQTNVAIYLDHKVADSTSTYKNVYLYGPIVPSNYDMEIVKNYLMIDATYSHRQYNQQINDDLYETFKQENPDFIENKMYKPSYDSKLKQVSKYLCDKAIKTDTIDRPEKNYIQFYPFIEMCNHSTELKKIITNPDVVNLNYTFFMYDIGIHTDLSEYDYIIKGDSIEKIKEAILLLDSYRCPVNWYKEGKNKLI